MSEIEELKKEIAQIKKRNKRVEADKSWETSLFRVVLIAVLTYFVIVLFFYVAELPKPWVNPVVPTVGFVLSTLTVPLAKRWWLRRKKQ